MSNHDVLSLAGMLRDHLAAHDRPLAFLFGAGTSSCINVAPIAPGSSTRTGFQPLIPGVDGMTIECKAAVDALGAAHTSAWEGVVLECKALKLDSNIESILGRVRTKIDALNSTDSISGLDRIGWTAVDDAVRKQIALLATPNLTSILNTPHEDLTRWVRNTTRKRPVEVFTTNYDVLFETTFDLMRVPHFDGFIGSQHAYFSPESVESDELLPSASWVRFWKLHGSISWAVETIATEQRISRGLPTKTGEMVLPSHRKYDESRKQPYRSLMDRLGRVLARPDSLLVVCGFSFGDQHINAILLDALERHPNTHMVALTYCDITEDHVVSKWAEALPNVLHVGPNAGVLRGRFGLWSHKGKPDKHLTDTTGGLAISDPSDPDKVRLCAGDFNVFGKFLAAIGGTEPTR